MSEEAKGTKDYATVGMVKKIANGSIFSIFPDVTMLAGRSYFVTAIADELNFKTEKGWITPVENADKLASHEAAGRTHIIKLAPVLEPKN